MNARIALVALVLAFVSFSMSSCKKPEIEDALDPSLNRPDLTWSVQVTGAETINWDMTVANNENDNQVSVATYFPTDNNLMNIAVSGDGYVLTMQANLQGLSGTSNVNSSNFTVTSSQSVYEGTAGTLTITNANRYGEQNQAGIVTNGFYSMSGSFSCTMQHAQTGAEINVEGSFSGMYMQSTEY